MMELIDFTLPEFTFLDGHSHLGDTLAGRTVLQHVRSYTVLEVLDLKDTPILEVRNRSYKFEYTNAFGVTEKHLFILHFTLADEGDLQEIFEKCRDFYCDYLKWEDENIIDDEKGKFN